VRVQAVDASVYQRCSVEHTVAAMHQMVVQRHVHGSRIRHNTARPRTVQRDPRVMRFQSATDRSTWVHTGGAADGEADGACDGLETLEA
jgi:hypothetical protein